MVNGYSVRSKRVSFFVSVAFLLALGLLVSFGVTALAQSPEVLRGSPDASPRWKSGWIDLLQPTNFYKGDQLRLTIGGTATKIVFRLLDDPSRADSTGGVVGVFTVASDRIVRITLDADYRGIQQLSVHGGCCPWTYDLGGGNGAATLTAAQVIRISRK